MTEPKPIHANIADEQAYVRARKAEIDTSTGKNEEVTWKRLGSTMNIASSTLSLFAVGKYAGDRQRVANDVRRHREALVRREEVMKGRLIEPGYLDLPTGQRVRTLLEIAATPDVTLVCAPPGTCKTFEAEQFVAATPGAVMVTANPVSGKLVPFVREVHKALGGTVSGRTDWVNSQIVKRIMEGRFVLVVDEAGWLDKESLEMARSWTDLKKDGKFVFGLCLLGNNELGTMIAGGNLAQQFGRLNSRIAVRMTSDIDLSGDIDLYLDAWGVDDPKVRQMLMVIGMQPGMGGLREVRQTLRNASEYAMLEKIALNAMHIHKAQVSRGKNALKAVA